MRDRARYRLAMAWLAGLLPLLIAGCDQPGSGRGGPPTRTSDGDGGATDAPARPAAPGPAEEPGR